MFRTGPHKNREGLLYFGKVIGRILALVAVLGLLADFAHPGRAHAGESVDGLEIVICSGDGAKTITVDREGNPIEEPGKAVCDCGCAACPSSGGVCLILGASATELPMSFATAVPRAFKSTNRTRERGQLPVPRGPPTEKEA